jgi:hypothetical protein
MKCDEVRQFLPDHVLGTLSDTESAAVRRHVRGCSRCRAETAELDEGVALFARAAHAAEPPPELKDRVLSVLEDEWAEANSPAHAPKAARRFAIAWQAVAAVLVLLAGLAAWGWVAQSNANRDRADARSYRVTLALLGGKDFRAGRIVPAAGFNLHGSVILYDSERSESKDSWMMVLAQAPGFTDEVTVSLEGPDRSIDLPFPLRFEADGDGWTGLVTSDDISSFDLVLFKDPSGRVIARAHVVSGE